MASYGWFFVGYLVAQIIYAVARRQGFKHGFQAADRVWRDYVDGK